MQRAGLAVAWARQMPAGLRFASFQIKPVMAHKCDGPGNTAECDKDSLLKYFEQMNVIRRIETTAGDLYRNKQIRGFCHLYSGQEAVAVGMKAALTPEDAVITAYRCHGWAYVLGVSPKAVIGELLGNSSGCSLGKGGSMHMYAKNFYGGNGIVGAQVPVGAGIALAMQYQKLNAVCVSLYGDGAANQGQVFEAYNMAKLWNLPALFVCENNQFGMGTSVERASANTEFYTRGDYIPGIKVDGMDVLAVKEATAWARNYALTHGPLVLEMKTYRYNGHSMSDPDTTYRKREDIKQVRETLDPINHCREQLLSIGVSEDELKKIESDARVFVKAQSEQAVAAPLPSTDLLIEHILKGEKLHNVRGCDQFTTYSASA